MYNYWFWKSTSRLNLLPKVHIGTMRKFHPLCMRLKTYSCIRQNIPIPSASRCHYSMLTWSTVLSTSSPVLAMQDFLIHVHNGTELHWWAVIMLTTFGIRMCITFPLLVHQQQVIARLENLRRELATLATELNKEVTVAARLYNWDLGTTKRMYKQNMQKYYHKFIVRDNCHPFKTVLLVFIQVPVWICLSAALRNLAFMQPYQNSESQLSYSQLQTEGALWFPDLTTPDMFLIPILLGTLNMILIEMHSLRRVSPGSRLQKVVQNIVRCITLFIVVVASVSPSCISFYWLCSSSLGLLQNSLLMMPKVRRAFRIPVTPSESASPFQDIVKNLRSKMTFK